MIALRVAAALAGLALAPVVTAGNPPKGPPTLDSLAGEVQVEPDTAPLPDSAAQAQAHYRKYLESTSADPARAAEALRRLGDLELESGEAGALERGDASLQPSTYAAAVARYRERLARYPEDPRNDAVLYPLARALESGGDARGALATLDTLVARHPQTALLDEVQFRRGELLFGERRFADAERAYAAVLALPDKTTFREPARYKLGWSRFRQDRHDAAVQAFMDLLDARFAGVAPDGTDAAVAAMPVATRELVDDSLRAMSLSFSSEQGLPSLQRALAARAGRSGGTPAYGYLVYLGLASQYLEQKRWIDASAVFAGYADAHPLDPRAQGLQQRAVAALEQGGFAAQALAARETYVARFGPDQPYWSAQKAPPDAGAITFLRESAWRVAQQHHARAQAATTAAADKPRAYRLAADAYRRYAAYFPHDARLAESRFLLGEVLYESGDFAGAITAYESAAYESAAYESAAYGSPPPARSAEAGYAALLAYRRQESALSGPAATAWRRQRLDAGLRFASAFPAHAQAAAARLDSAQGLLDAGALPEAAKAAAALTATAGATADQRRAAWRVQGHAYSDAGDHAAAERAYLEAARLDAAAGLKDATLIEHLAASIYRQGEQARADGKADEAASAFLRVARSAPTASIVATAEYEAAQACLDAGRARDAVAILQRFATRHRGSRLAPQAAARLALAQLELKDDAAAATTFEAIANDPATPPAEQREALAQAAQIHAARKDGAGEARVLTRQLALFGAEDFAAGLEARHRLMTLALARSDPAAVKAQASAVVALESGGAQRSARSRWIAAQAALRLADPAREAFLATRLSAPLDKSLKRKQAQMESALAAYGRAADYGAADALTESTFRIGEIYQALATALIESERPKKLDAQARQEYDLIVQEQAFGFEERAIELHEANARRAREGLYDAWVRRSFASLAALVPVRYARPARHPAPTAALATLEAAAGRSPPSAVAQFQLGQALVDAGRFDDADAAFARAIAADARQTQAFYERGVLNELYLQRADEALRSYETFQSSLAQPDPQVKVWIEQLRRRSAAAAPAAGSGS